MLRSLSVSNYVLIDSLDITFPEGLIIITGQTGAGKSILIGALSLLLGAKADSSAIREGAERCTVEGEFSIPSSSERARSLLEENDVEWDGGHLILRRVVNASGRSRSFINDTPVSVQLLSELSSSLIDIHSQHQSLMLTDARFQLSVLDHFAGTGGLLEECRSLWKDLQARKSELSEIRESLGRLSAEKEYNEAQFRQLDEAKLRDGELEELEAEQKQLANAEDIKTALCRIGEMFSASDGMQERQSLGSMLREAEHLLDKASAYVPSLASLSSRMESSRIEIEDILSDVETVNSSVEASPERLEAVEDRMSMLYGLMKKHGCSDVASLIETREKYSEALFDSVALEERASSLEAVIAELSSKLDAVSGRLHEAREEAAPKLAEQIQSSLRYLELDRAVFEVILSQSPLGATGSDAVHFMFSANGGRTADVSKCASGGEISRIMLSLKAMMARFTAMPSMIFDEIDTGVSGSAADKMGSMICSMGDNMQVFAITHLPQVAAKGRAHYLVSKDGDTTSIKLLSDEERVMEIARLLSGASVTAAALANARELLSQ